VSPTRRAIILTRALAYDANLTARAGSSYTIAVLYRKGDPASERTNEEVMRAFKPLESVNLAGLPFRAVSTPFSGAAPLEALVDKEGLDSVLVCEGLEGDLAAIKQVSRKRKILTLGTQEAQATAGVSLAVVKDGAKLQIVINLPQSREEGAAFGSDLLRIARVLK
jgi:hypothetical protein